MHLDDCIKSEKIQKLACISIMTLNIELLSLLHIRRLSIIDFHTAAFPQIISREAKPSNIPLFPIVIPEDVRNNGTLRDHRLARSKCIIHRSRDIDGYPSIVAETPRRPIPFPKSLLREIVIRDERRDDEEAARDNRNRARPRSLSSSFRV